MATVCQTCGDRGYAELLLHCSVCQISAEHEYCLDVTQIEENEDFIKWTCCECLQKGLTVDSKCSSDETKDKIRSQNVRESCTASKCCSLEKAVNVSSSRQTHSEGINNAGDSSLTKVDKKRGAAALEKRCNYVNDCSAEKCKRQRRLILADDNSSDEEPTYVRTGWCHKGGEATDANAITKRKPVGTSSGGGDTSPAVKRSSIPGASEPRFQASDVCNPSFNISHQQLASNCKNYVHAQPIIYPVWSDGEVLLDQLICEINDKDLVLKVMVEELELLIFSSQLLPLQYSTFQGKCYLWGAFRGRQMHPPDIDVVTSNSIDKTLAPSLSHVEIQEKNQPMKSQSSSPQTNNGNDRQFLEKQSDCGNENDDHAVEAPDKSVSMMEAPTVTVDLDVAEKDGTELELFPLAVEDMAVTARMGKIYGFDLELGLGVPMSDGGSIRSKVKLDNLALNKAIL